MKKAALGIGGTVVVVAGLAVIWKFVLPFITTVLTTIL